MPVGGFRAADPASRWGVSAVPQPWTKPLRFDAFGCLLGSVELGQPVVTDREDETVQH